MALIPWHTLYRRYCCGTTWFSVFAPGLQGSLGYEYQAVTHTYSDEKKQIKIVFNQGWRGNHAFLTLIPAAYYFILSERLCGQKKAVL